MEMHGIRARQNWRLFGRVRVLLSFQLQSYNRTICTKNMTKINPFVIYFMVSLSIVALIVNEVSFVKGIDLPCVRGSKTWKGLCFSSSKCRRKCMELEHAQNGACSVLVCYCRFNYNPMSEQCETDHQ
ncbi:defensin-like protein 19 isoform X2 [Alnus glutinosa]|uniref:defensin-like protein 19 isoform X2 n=1 Tax=Alnus glutinosa TaxID=3517 RepID=UPI002D769C83|nr:defensin-like protein 19 isoform X2 [Alnus glutinosa]